MDYSFIIPVYNCKDYLAVCVDGIRSVGVGTWEILLVDDGSTDGSGDLCDKLAERYPEIRVIHQPNAGASAARNRGIQESGGEKILFIDADDSLDADALGTVLADTRCGQVDMVIFGLTFDYYYHGKCYRQDPMFFDHDGILGADAWGRVFAKLFEKNSLSPLWNKVFRREILMRHQLRLNEDMFLYEDFEFVLRYMAHCDTIWNVPRAVYHYRQTEDEGNAGRRLRRISSVPDFLKPIETSLNRLRTANSAVTKKQTDTILQLLYLTLANQKLAVSDLPGIHQICREFSRWAGNRDLPIEPSKYQQRLMKEQALLLYLSNQKTALRHWLAIRVKAFLNK